MTDDKIKEEFEKWYVSPSSKEETEFAETIGYKGEGKGFYAGFMAACRIFNIRYGSENETKNT